MTTAAATPTPPTPTPASTADADARGMPPVLGRLLRGSFWLALRSPIQAVIAFWQVPLILRYLGEDANGAYQFAWGFGFIQFLLEFGMSSALQRTISERWTCGDRDGVNRAVACGTAFYAAMAVLQAGVLLGIAYIALPHAGYQAGTYSYDLVFRLLWLQAITAPCYGISSVVAAVLQAARRYDFIPRMELGIVVLRFLVLLVGIAARADFLAIVVVQVTLQIVLLLGPALWVMVRELDYVPHMRGASLGEFRELFVLSGYVFLIQLSVVLADRIDTTILGFVLPTGEAGPATTVYSNVSKPFVQIRHTGWMLSYMVMPAVASLVAAKDVASLERLKYDGTRYLVALLTPVGLLACIDAAPFLSLWVGPRYADTAGLLRLFLVAVLPLVISVLVQAAIGLGRVKVIALAALGGAIVNLPISYVLTLRIGVAGVIWGTVLTTLVSNLLIPGVYAFRVLEVRPSAFLRRALGPPLAGASALVVALGLSRLFGFDPAPDGPRADALAAALSFLPVKLARALPFLADLALGCLAYAAGYLAVPTGRGDLAALAGKLRRRNRAG